MHFNLHISLTVELIDDTRSHMYIDNPTNRPANNITLGEIAHASQSNNATTFSERHKLQLNDAARNSQTLSFEENFALYTKRFNQASDTVRAHMLHEINRQLDILDKEEQNVINLQDPPEMGGRRTFSRGGRRRLTATEFTEKQLQRNDKIARETPKVQWRPTELETLTSPSNTRVSMQEVQDIIIVESWPTKEVEGEVNAYGNHQIQRSNNQVALPLQTSPSRPQRRVKHRSIYEGEFMQPQKRIRRGN